MVDGFEPCPHMTWREQVFQPVVESSCKPHPGTAGGERRGRIQDLMENEPPSLCRGHRFRGTVHDSVALLS